MFTIHRLLGCFLALAAVNTALAAATTCTDHTDCVKASECDVEGFCFEESCIFAQHPSCANGQMRVVKSIAERPQVTATDGNLNLVADVLKKVTIRGGEVEYLLPDRAPVTMTAMVDHMTNLTDRADSAVARADSADHEITNLTDRADSADKEILRLETDLGQTLTDKINEVEENFKEVVDATLTPAVDSLTASSADLGFRLLKLETACNNVQYEKIAASGDTLENFKPPTCAAVTICKDKVEFETKAPTATSDRACQVTTICTDAQFIKSEVTEKSNRVCQATTVCAVGKEFEFIKPTTITDRVCKVFTVCDATKDEVQSSAPSPTADRVCKTADPTLGGVGHGNPAIMSQDALKYLYDRLGRANTRPNWKPMKLCYSAKRDGWSTAKFHQNCDGQGPTISVQKMKSGRVLGGYQSQSMNSNGGWMGSNCNGASGTVTSSPWIFRVTPGNANHVDYFYHQRYCGSYSVYRNPSYAMTWGGGHDLSCEQDFRHCYSNLGYNYGNSGLSLGTGQYGSTNVRNALAGKYSWNARNEMSDYEVYLVNKTP